MNKNVDLDFQKKAIHDLQLRHNNGSSGLFIFPSYKAYLHHVIDFLNNAFFDSTYKMNKLYQLYYIFATYTYYDRFEKKIQWIIETQEKLCLDILHTKPDNMMSHVWDGMVSFIKYYYSGDKTNVISIISWSYTYVKNLENEDEADTVYVDTRNKVKQRSLIIWGGVLLLKFYQTLAATHPELSVSFQNIEPMSEVELNQSILNVKQSFRSLAINNKPMKVASIGQVHEASMNGISYVIKFLKPRAVIHLVEELAYILMDVSVKLGENKDALSHLISSALNIINEFDFMLELQNLSKGMNVYSGGGINVVGSPQKLPLTVKPVVNTNDFISKIDNLSKDRTLTDDQLKDKFVSMFDEMIRLMAPLQHNYLLMSKAPGVTIQTMVNNKQDCQRVTEPFKMLIEIWLFNAIFQDGFFHADLHAGNILYDNGQLTLIDFGHCATLPKTLQCDLLDLVLIYIYTEHIVNEHNRLMTTITIQPDKHKVLVDLVKMMMQKISRICKDSKYDENTVKTKVEEFIMTHVGTIEKPLTFSSLLETIIMNVMDLGDCTKSSIVDFTKGVKLLENTWLTLLQNSKGPKQETNIMKIGLANTTVGDTGFFAKCLKQFNKCAKVANCSSLKLNQLKEILMSNP